VIAVLAAIAIMALAGLPIALAVDRHCRGFLLAGLSFLYGSGATFLVMELMSAAGVQWTLSRVLISLAIMAALAGVTATRNPHPAPRDPRPATRGPLPYLLDTLTLLFLAGYTLYTTLAAVWEWDFWAIWGLKGHVFLEHGGIDWRFLESPWNRFCHPDYPILLPLNFDFIGLVQRGWDDRWLGLLNVAFALALLLIVRTLASQESGALMASIVTLTIASTAASRYIGMAEGPLIAFGAAGVLFARRADPIAMRHAALLLGFAANCKNEGLALLVAVVIVSRRARLWPAFVLVVPWLLLRAIHVLPTDLAAGPVTARLLAHLRDPMPILSGLVQGLVDPWLWGALIAGLIVLPSAARRREWFVLAVTILQIAFYAGSYFVTPNEVHWHIATSWPRLTRQILVPFTYVVILALANWLVRGEDAPHAEARSDL
jgi:hypothetical protein